MSSHDTSSPRPSASPEPARKSGGKKRKADQPEIEVDLALPEPPSKRARRALKKGKPLPPKPASDSDEADGPRASRNGGGGDDDKDGKAATAAKKERSPYGVWIGNLRFTVTRDELRQWLVDSSGGTITPELITRVHLPRARRPASAAAAEFENKGFAYVDFATYEANLAAVALSETEWYRRRLLIKDATSFEGRPEEHALKKKGEAAGNEGQKKEEEEPVSKSRKIFVGNLGFQATEDDVRELFAPCGEIEWVKVATFEDSGKCKGYGWVKFAEAAAADWAAKGFVKIKEVEETEEDFIDSDAEAEGKKGDDDDDDEKEKEEEESDSDGSGSSEDDGDDASEKKPAKKPAQKPTKKPKAAPEKKVKTRKWWVNTLHGRRLKIEHAEDDQTRYKKRYGKGAQQRQQNGDGGAGRPPHRGDRPQAARHNNQKKKWGDRSDARSHQDGGRPAARSEPAEPDNFRADISVARLTGAVVKPEGKKITFD